MFTKLSDIYKMPLKVYYYVETGIDKYIIKERVIIADGDYACYEDSPFIKINSMGKVAIDGSILISYSNLNNCSNGNFIYFLSYDNVISYIKICLETEIAEYEAEIESRRKKIASLNEETYLYDTSDIIDAAQ